MKNSSPACGLCGRAKPLQFHHLIPRRLHSNKWFKKNHTRDAMQQGINVCGDCHAAIHRFIPHKELARLYNTREKLLKHPQLGAFIAWVAKRNSKTHYRTRVAQQ